MARSRSTFGKMQREQEKRSRARAKQEKRFAKREDQPDDEAGPAIVEDQASVLEALAQLHEDFADGRISLDDFEERQEELRSSIRVD
jgi:hypothetical protein